MTNQELQRRGSTELRTGDKDEISLIKAVKSPRITQASAEEIKEILRFVMVKVGLRAQNFPNDIEKVVLIDHIKENYGGNHLSELRLAFDMAISGKLALKPDDVKCYENFSCAYVSVIMNAYRNWSAQAHRQSIADPQKEQRIYSQDEIDNGLREDAERQYRLFLTGHKLRGIEFNKPILLNDGLINESESVLEFFTRMADAKRINIYYRDNANCGHVPGE